MPATWKTSPLPSSVVRNLRLVALAEDAAHDQPQADDGRKEPSRGKHASYLQASYNRHGLWCESHAAGRESRRAALVALALLLVPVTAAANGRPPMTNSVFFKPGDTHAIYVATTFGLLISPDGCTFDWLCEDSVGYRGDVSIRPMRSVRAARVLLPRFTV